MYLEMFDQSWRYLAEHFYDASFHGHDWNAVRAKYRPLVKHVTMKEDLYALLYLMMGELNASHLGVVGFTAFPEEETADLGLIFDEGYRGRGLKIAEKLKRGPADRRGVNLKAGEFILNIDGEEVTPASDLSKLLNGKAGEMVTLQVASKADVRPSYADGLRCRPSVAAPFRRSCTIAGWRRTPGASTRSARASSATSTSRAWTRKVWIASCARSTPTTSTRKPSFWTFASTAAASRTIRC